MDRQQTQIVIGVIAAALTTAFALSNSQPVKVDWLVTSTSSRLIYVIVSSALVGAIAGYVIARRKT